MAKKSKDRLGLGRINYILLLVATALLILGFIIMSANEISISPLILVIAYVVIIPFALLYRPKKD
ncbi:MAG TPA: hypothetical protein PL124_03470 [Candidatus Cloacimonadota bacterium]|nr:hypothetical protein [Candidatus Cloacimonadota bacterium]HPS38453.1 hypothetical protein [Candidatus Cloacimonadota bacterium]